MVSHNAKFTQFFSKFSCLILTSFLLFSTEGCKNFFNGTDFLSQLEESVSYENAQQSTFTVKADSGTGSFLSDGDKTAKVGFDFSLQFTLNTEDYVLNHWGVFNPDDMSEIPDILETTTISTEEELARGVYKVNIKFLRQVSNVILKPVCYVIPKAIYINTRDESRADGFTQDTDIIIKFNKPIPEDWFIIDSVTGVVKNIEITCQVVNLLEPGPKYSSYQGSRFQNTVLSDDCKMLRIPTQTNASFSILEDPDKRNGQGNPGYPLFYSDSYAEISVKLTPTKAGELGKDTVKGEGVSFNKDIEWKYKINSKFDNEPPEIKECHVYRDVTSEGIFIDEYPVLDITKEYKPEELLKTVIASKKITWGEYPLELTGSLFFSAIVSDSNGINSAKIYFTQVKPNGMLEKEEASFYIDESTTLKVTQINETDSLVQGFIQMDNHDIPSGYYQLSFTFSDFSANESNGSKLYASIQNPKDYRESFFNAWNELSDVTGKNAEEAKALFEKDVKKIYISYPKNLIRMQGAPTCSGFTGKVYYGHDYTKVNEQSNLVSCVPLSKENGYVENGIEYDKFSFNFSDLSATQDNYFKVVLFDGFNESGEKGNISRIFSVPAYCNVSDLVYNDSTVTFVCGETNKLNKKYNIRTYKFDENTNVQSNNHTSKFNVTGCSETSKAVVLYGNNYSGSDYSDSTPVLYGLPCLETRLQSSSLQSGAPSFEYGLKIKKSMKGDYSVNSNELVFDLTIPTNDGNTYVLTITNVGEDEYFSKFPFVLQNISKYTYNSNGTATEITAKLKKITPEGKYCEVYPKTIQYYENENTHGTEVTLTNGKITLADITCDIYSNKLDVIPPTLNGSGKKLTAFPNVFYLTGNYDRGSGFNISENEKGKKIFDGNLRGDSWNDNWKTVDDYLGTFSPEAGISNLTARLTKNLGTSYNDLGDIMIEIDMSYFEQNKYLIRTANGIWDVNNNSTDLALDYLYVGDLYDTYKENTAATFDSYGKNNVEIFNKAYGNFYNEHKLS